MWGVVRNVKHYILINATPRGPIQASKELRQGSSIPSLFLLVVDVLSRIIYEGVGGTIVDPFSVGGMKLPYRIFNSRMITMLLRSGKEESFLIINHIVAFFEDLFRLKIIRRKYSIFGIKTDQAKLLNWAEMFDCKVGLFPSTYLGLPLGGNLEALTF